MAAALQTQHHKEHFTMCHYKNNKHIITLLECIQKLTLHRYVCMYLYVLNELTLAMYYAECFML